MKKMGKTLSALLALSLMAQGGLAARAENTELFSEDFERSGFVTNEADGTSDWYSSLGYGFSEDTSIVHDGEKSLSLSDAMTIIKYRGSKSVGNYVYEFWFYDDGNVGTGMVDLTGTTADGTVKSEQILFGPKQGAWGTRYILGPYQATDFDRTVGWHHVVLDTTTNGKLTAYVDGKAQSMVQNKSVSVYNVTGIEFMNKWYAGKGYKFNIDSMKAYNSYDEVPLYRKTVMESIKFDSGIDAEGADDIVLSDGDLNISFSTDMSAAEETNFKLLKRVSSSNNDAEYEDASFTLNAADSRSVSLSIDELEADTTYRLAFSGLKTAEGKKIADDFITFTTYDDLTWNREGLKGLVFEDGFENTEFGDNWTASEGITLSSARVHDGSQAMVLNNFSNSGANIQYTGEQKMGNYAYSFWFYDPYQGADFASKGSSGCSLADLTGTNADGSSITQKAMFGVKHDAYYGNYIMANTQTSGISRTQGWHYVVMDASTAGKLTVYVDGVASPAKGIHNPVTGFRIFSGWNKAAVNFVYDNFRVFKTYENVPVYKTNIIDAVKFDDGRNADGAADIIKIDKNINVTFKKAMNVIGEDNIELLSRDISSETDSDFAAAGFSIVSSDENGFTVSVDDMQPSKEYRLRFKNFTAADGTLMADDFISFKTAENIDLAQSVVEKIAFDNGVRIPSVGIPETFGDLIVHFSEKMNPDTINSDTVVITKADGTVINYLANMSDNAYTVNSASLGLEPESTYTVKITQGAKTETGNYAMQDEEFSFTTSKDLAHQDPIFAEDFEGDVTLTQNNTKTVTDNVHGGEKAIGIGRGGYVKYDTSACPNAVYEAWLYDTGDGSDNIVLHINGTDASGNAKTRQFGTKNGWGNKYWINGDILLGERSAGWHRFIIDFRNPDEVDYYIDDELVATRKEDIQKVSDVSIYNQFNNGYMYADDMKIWNAVDYDVISRIEENKAFICDENYNSVLGYKAGDKVYIALNVSNQQPELQEAVLLVAEYENGVLKNVYSSEDTWIPAGESVNLRTEYTIPDNFENIQLKAFCWDSKKTMKALMPASDPKGVTAVFLGGSITAGTGASETAKNYVSLVGNYMKNTYGAGSEVNIVNSGVGGKGSAFGVSYFDSYVAKYAPDVLFVEYAVNDRVLSEAEVTASMEKLVEKAYALAKRPQIVFIYTATYRLDACTSWHQVVADKYSIPSINLQSALEEKVNADIAADPSIETTWKNNGMPYLSDGVHPTDLGYAFYAENIINALKADIK